MRVKAIELKEVVSMFKMRQLMQNGAYNYVDRKKRTVMIFVAKT